MAGELGSPEGGLAIVSIGVRRYKFSKSPNHELAAVNLIS